MSLVLPYITDRLRRSSRLRGTEPEYTIDKLDLTVKESKSKKKSVSNVKTTKMSQVYKFEESVLQSTFKGKDFYGMKKDDLFLTDSSIVENILCQGKKIRQQLKQLQPGQTLRIGNAITRDSIPLIIKKGGPNSNIKDDDYTLNRLTGMCAAYAAQQSAGYEPKCAMAIALGLSPNRDRILYYSAAPGAEHFPEVFSYFPLLCALQQLEMGKVAKENISRIATVKDDKGRTLSEILVSQKSNLPRKLGLFGSGGSRGTLELEKALNVLKTISRGST